MGTHCKFIRIVFHTNKDTPQSAKCVTIIKVDCTPGKKMFVNQTLTKATNASKSIDQNKVHVACCSIVLATQWNNSQMMKEDMQLGF